MTITENSKDIILTQSPDNIICVPKEGTGVELSGDYVTLVPANGFKFKMKWQTITSPVVTSGLALYNALIVMSGNSGGVPEVFVAGVNQTIFTPIITPNSTTVAFTGGNVYSVGNGLSIVGTTVVFTIPFVGGEIVQIVNI